MNRDLPLLHVVEDLQKPVCSFAVTTGDKIDSAARLSTAWYRYAQRH
nr:hypothetical protein [Escherichia coli]